MRLDRFDLNLLVVLDTLLEERNVTKASRRLYIGQSATSGALARLREYFGDELLVPMGRQLVLTPLAQSLVEPVGQTLLHARSTIARKPGFEPATAQRRVVVCASDYVTAVLLADVVRRLALEAPGVVLDIRSPMQDVFERFDRGGIDLLIMPQQYLTHLAQASVALFDDSYACMVWTGNTAAGPALSLSDYMAMGHVTVHFSDERNTAFEEWFAPRYGKQRKLELSVDNFGVLPLVVIGTQRIATLHRKQAEHFARHLPLRLIDPPFEMPSIVEAMVWPSHVEHDPAHQWLREVMLQCAPKPSIRVSQAA